MIGTSFIVAALAAVLAGAAPASSPPAQRPSCPHGYSLVVGLCVSDSTGDVVLPLGSK